LVLFQAKTKTHKLKFWLASMIWNQLMWHFCQTTYEFIRKSVLGILINSKNQMQHGKRIHILIYTRYETTLHEQPRCVSNLAQGFIRWG